MPKQTIQRRRPEHLGVRRQVPAARCRSPTWHTPGAAESAGSRGLPANVTQCRYGRPDAAPVGCLQAVTTRTKYCRPEHQWGTSGWLASLVSPPNAMRLAGGRTGPGAEHVPSSEHQTFQRPILPCFELKSPEQSEDRPRSHLTRPLSGSWSDPISMVQVECRCLIVRAQTTGQPTVGETVGRTVRESHVWCG